MHQDFIIYADGATLSTTIEIVVKTLLYKFVYYGQIKYFHCHCHYYKSYGLIDIY